VNISISELLLVFLIGLLVVKPEQLPQFGLTLGRFIKTMRSFFSKIKQEMQAVIDSPKQQDEHKPE
jgi:Sec-independent protein translocase protein TatA